MIKTKKNKSILKRILAFLGAGICAIACCFTIFNISKKSDVDAEVVNETYTYQSALENVKVSNNGSFSKNLFDVNLIVTDTGIYSNGKVDVSYGFNFSNYINIDKYVGCSIAISGNINNNYSFFYDKQKKPIGSIILVSDGSVVEIPQNAYYYAFEFQYNGDFNSLQIQIEISSIATEYVPYQRNDYISLNSTFITNLDLNNSLILNKVLFNVSSNNFNYGTLDYINGTLENNEVYINTNTKGVILNSKLYSYNTTTKEINYNNNFNLYFMYDYIDSSNYNSSTYFNGNVKKIIYGSYKDKGSYFKNEYTGITESILNSKYNFISYIDVNDNNVNIIIPLDSNYDNDYYTFHTIFLTGGISDSYSNGYNNGYLDGYNNGYNDAKSPYYNKGYFDGKKYGYETGYNKGINESNDYTFLGLISACIDAPITYFTSLFNFELLGVNISSFLTAIFTLCIIVTVVRLCLGR